MDSSMVSTTTGVWFRPLSEENWSKPLQGHYQSVLYTKIRLVGASTHEFEGGCGDAEDPVQDQAQDEH